MIQAILQIVKELLTMLNRESSSDEKIKDSSIKNVKNYKKAVFFARQIFDGNKKFKGLDVMLEHSLSKEDYEQYLTLRKKFNRFS